MDRCSFHSFVDLVCYVKRDLSCKAKRLLISSNSYLYLWPQTLGGDQKNEIADTGS